MAGEGATQQDGAKPVFQCDCGTSVVWVKSKRTGRNYLATCYPRRNEGLYYVKAAPHTHEAHAQALADKEAWRKFDEPNAIAYEQARAEYERIHGEQS